jgi:hypothetical protein
MQSYLLVDEGHHGRRCLRDTGDIELDDCMYHRWRAVVYSGKALLHTTPIDETR